LSSFLAQPMLVGACLCDLQEGIPATDTP
jgi:hypothetical protein